MSRSGGDLSFESLGEPPARSGTGVLVEIEQALLAAFAVLLM